MDLYNQRLLKLSVLLSILTMLTACAAGVSDFTQAEPAGFFYGIWHGAISIVSLIIHMFNQNVLVYEIHNVGGWYDFGFLLGVIMIWGGGSHMSCKSSAQKEKDKEWDEICNKVEIKVMHKLKDWSKDEELDETDKDWEEIGEKVEKKLKRKIREWAEKD